MKEENEYTLVYQGDKFDKSDSEYKEGDWNCYFLNGKKTIYFRRTKTLEAANLSKGKKYILRTDKLDNPIYVKGNGVEIIRMGNKIIRHDLKAGTYYNVTHRFEVDENFNPLNGEKTTNGSLNNTMSALKKIIRGDLTETILKRMNSSGVFFKVHLSEPKGNRSNGFICSIDKKRNHILIEGYDASDIDDKLQKIKQDYLKNGLEKYFKIETVLLQKKGTKKK